MTTLYLWVVRFINALCGRYYWTVKFRNGNVKRFKFPVRTTSEGAADAYLETKGANPDDECLVLESALPT